MSWVAVSVGAGVVGGIIQGSAAEDAEDAQYAASRDARQLSKEQFDTVREDQRPFREAGYSALNRLQELLGIGGDRAARGYGSLAKPFTGANLAKEPGYQFEMAEGEKAINRSAGARGLRLSGATLKALQRYGQDVASTKYNQAFDRNQVTGNTLFNRLSGISGTGQTATDRVGQAGQIYAGQAGDAIIGAGNAAAASRVAQGNIFGNTVNQGISQWLRSGGGAGGGDVYSYDYRGTELPSVLRGGG